MVSLGTTNVRDTLPDLRSLKTYPSSAISWGGLAVTTTCFTRFMVLVERTTLTSLLDRPGSSHNAVRTPVWLLK